jgi:hypothetical protein
MCGTEPCGIPACISLGVDISSLTETVNFLGKRKELISFIRLIKNFNSDNLYRKLRCQAVLKAFQYPRIQQPYTYC